MVEPLPERTIPGIILLGPTASGKTALSLKLAQALNGEVVSCDSVAVYREFDIGSAKPSAAQRALVPHHLLDVAEPAQTYTAGDYSRDARVALSQIASRGHVPILVGGTGLYLRALVQGLFAGPVRSTDLRAKLERSRQRLGGGWLHRLLQRLDPASAARIHAKDEPKLIRALEVTLLAGTPMSQAWLEGRNALTGYSWLRLGLNPQRPLLYERINQRAAAMFHEGLVEETAGIVQRHGHDCWALGALGYRQAVEQMAGSLSPEAAIAQAQQGHRNYAKRQLTWFRREPDVEWLAGFGFEAAIEARALALAAAHVSQLHREGNNAAIADTGTLMNNP